ncbi:MAG: hypothetical protein WC960_07070 [Bacteroidales bacterium]
MLQLSIVYIILVIVVALSLYEIVKTVVTAFKSPNPTKCMGCYLKESCDVNGDKFK